MPDYQSTADSQTFTVYFPELTPTTYQIEVFRQDGWQPFCTAESPDTLMALLAEAPELAAVCRVRPVAA